MALFLFFSGGDEVNFSIPSADDGQMSCCSWAHLLSILFLTPSACFWDVRNADLRSHSSCVSVTEEAVGCKAQP